MPGEYTVKNLSLQDVQIITITTWLPRGKVVVVGDISQSNLPQLAFFKQTAQ
jgi:hypothetical protein